MSTGIKIMGWFIGLLLMAFTVQAAPPGKSIYFYGSPTNDLYVLLKKEGFTLHTYQTPVAAVKAAPKGAGVFIVAAGYPRIDAVNNIDNELLNEANNKGLRLYIEYPASFPGLDIPAQPLETHFERAVVTGNQMGGVLTPMSLMGIHSCHVLPVQADQPLLVLAKVVGFDKAEYGLADTKTYPLLFEKQQALVCMTGLSNFKTGRYGPRASITDLWSYIIGRITGDKNYRIKSLPQDVQPMYARNNQLPASARLTSIKKGASWFSNARFFVHPAWRDEGAKYASNGHEPLGPPLSPDKVNGDGTMGVIEGHTSTIYADGRQQVRYWMRADVQGETSMALAAAGKLLNNKEHLERSANLFEYVFNNNNSNLRAGAKNDSTSSAYGLIGWSTSNSGSFYGDDNARCILGYLCAAGYLNTDKWDKVLAEAIMGNFRTTGKHGFRTDRLEEPNIVKNGWQYYYNRDVVYPSPHFESWMWALYLWLYKKTGYEPLLTKTKEAIKITMDGYPDKWLWGSSLQTQRARMILPLAWLVRIENTEEHRQWLDKMVNEIIRYQDESGAIREEIGKGKGMFRELKKNSDYGSDEGSLIFKNGEKASCMIYTCNFALFSLHEAAMATGNKKYWQAVNKLSDFLTRIQVQSAAHKDLDGAWFRGFDFGRWDYWASNSDAGWGVWCTETGWIQGWIVATQVQILQHQSFWDVTQHSKMEGVAKQVIKSMMKE